MSSVTAMILCELSEVLFVYQANTAFESVFQCLGGTALITAGQCAFVNRMIATLPESINPTVVIEAGATQIRHLFPVDQVPAIVISYMEGIRLALGLSIGATGIAFVITFFSRWKGPQSRGKLRKNVVAEPA